MEDIEYKITTKGIKIAGGLTGWQNINRFWFLTKNEDEILEVETLTIPGKIEIVINKGIEEQLKKEMSAYVPYEEAKPTTLDKVTNWFSKKLPGNN